jgi:hypothetical protein
VRLPMGDIIFLAVSTVLAYFFAFFVVAMMCDQREAAITDVTGIESNPVTLERGGGPMYWVENLRSTPEGFADVCGEPCSLRWLLPAPMRSRYQWSPLDDCDAYDKRDPRAIHHFKWVMQTLESGKAPPPVPLAQHTRLAATSPPGRRRGPGHRPLHGHGRTARARAPAPVGPTLH